MEQRQRDKIHNFLKLQKLAVISTNEPMHLSPESALVAFAEDSNLSLYFQTGVHTRKAVNLRTNQHVSLVIGLTLETLITVQYEGVAQRLSAPDDLDNCRKLFLEKHSPTTEEYFNHPSAIFFRVTPTWIGCSDYSRDSAEVIEIKTFEIKTP
jgi:general stress protein 26